MDGWERLMVLVLALSLATVAYTYAVYPGLIWVLARVFGRPPPTPTCRSCRW